jgi:hypothetical protein
MSLFSNTNLFYNALAKFRMTIPQLNDLKGNMAGQISLTTLTNRLALPCSFTAKPTSLHLITSY